MRVRNRLDSLSLLSCLPWLVSCISANGLLSLSAGSSLLSATTSQTQTADAGQKPSDGHAPDAEGWEAIRGSNSPALFEQFLKEYPNSQYAGAARLKLAALGSATTPKLPARKVVEPVILSKADPGYSEEARAARIQGTVLVVAQVDERGEAKDIKVIRGLGFGLDNRAIESVQQWRFRPGTKDGTPAEFTMAFEVEFHLPEGGPWRIEGASLGRKYEKGAPPGIETKPTLRQYVTPSAEACAQNGGYVVVQLQIDKNGATSDVKALMSPSDSVGDAAVAAVRSWIFSPALLDKRPKPSAGRVVLACEGPGFSVAEADRSDTVARNTKGFSQPKVIFKIDPEYAEEARKAKDSGSVLISIVIDQMGRPKSARVVRSLGHGLDEKAVEAVSQWRFTPAMNGDKPVTTVGTIEVNFRLL